jgi:hypothetical protein
VLHVALTAIEPGGSARGRDFIVRAGGSRLVAELTDELATWLGLPSTAEPYGLVVQRTGEHLVPTRRLDQVDLREGDIVLLLQPGETSASRQPRRRLRRLSDGSA